MFPIELHHHLYPISSILNPGIWFVCKIRCQSLSIIANLDPGILTCLQTRCHSLYFRNLLSPGFFTFFQLRCYTRFSDPGIYFPASHCPHLIFYPHSQKILFSKNYIVTTTKNRAYEIVFFSHTLPFPVLFITPLPWHPPYILCFFAAKKSLVSLTTTPFNANSAIIFGIAISPLKISAMVHTALTVMYGPINTAKI